MSILLNPTSAVSPSSRPPLHQIDVRHAPTSLPSQPQQNNFMGDASLSHPASLKSVLRENVTLEDGRLIHCHVFSEGLERDVSLSNHIISMYGKCGAVPDAQFVFQQMHERDVVSWNAMIGVYAQHGCYAKAMVLLENMGSSGIEPDTTTFISILRRCDDNPVEISQIEWIHCRTIESGFEADSVVSTALLNMYGKSCDLDSAIILFQKLEPCTTIPWNAIISAHSQQGHNEEALDLFYEMQLCGIRADKVTFISVISACASLQALDEGKNVHLQMKEYGFDYDIVVSNALITMYGKCLATNTSRFIFDRMPQHDLASWNAMLGAYVHGADGAEALSLFRSMQENNVKPNTITYVSLLCACESLASVSTIYKIHAYTVCDGLDLDHIVSTELLHIYGRCGDLEDAKVLFNRMPQHNLISWNVMISVYAQQGLFSQAIKLVQLSVQKGLEIDEVTLVSALTACCTVTAIKEGRLLHAHVLDRGSDCNVIVGNALLSMYGNCEYLDDACLLFEKMPSRNVVTWNALMDAHVRLGKGIEALEIFKKMKMGGMEPDQGTYVSALGGCAITSDLTEGRLIHMSTIHDGLKSDILDGALMNMYGKCRSLDDAELVFQNINKKNVICWNNIISLYSFLGNSRESLLTFRQMQQLGLIPNKVTLLIALNVCILLTNSKEAQMIHGNIVKRGFETDAQIGTALMNMYGKFGALEDARKTFDGITYRDVISWNALISVYAQQGYAEKSLEIFEEMILQKVTPNDVTFINLLSSCSHAGFLEQGEKFFHSMQIDYEIKPTAEHFGCMVDLYGRAGQLTEAENFISKWSQEDQPLVWTNLLGACRLHGDMERGKQIAERIVHLQAQDATTYLLLASLCQ